MLIINGLPSRFSPYGMVLICLQGANIIENHQEETLAHWESHFTNTCIEELNSVFSATKRKARGHHTTKEANHHAPLRRR